MGYKIALLGWDKALFNVYEEHLSKEHDIVYKNSDRFSGIEEVINSGPDVTVLLNRRKYEGFIRAYSKTGRPLVVVTGGGSCKELESENVHFIFRHHNLGDISGKISEILTRKQSNK
ncbi:hypothetical protein KY330_05060 [Candidatus Woesearchaeota archaeon]|nr:hypothetical protein [Candidatus Woesearchaeota archaeon]